jgi:hypothetical protein
MPSQTLVVEKGTPWSNLVVGASMAVLQGKHCELSRINCIGWTLCTSMTAVTTLGQPMEVIKTHVSKA